MKKVQNKSIGKCLKNVYLAIKERANIIQSHKEKNATEKENFTNLTKKYDSLKSKMGKYELLADVFKVFFPIFQFFFQNFFIFFRIFNFSPEIFMFFKICHFSQILNFYRNLFQNFHFFQK